MHHIAALIKSAEWRVWVAMYTLTDNILSDALLQAVSWWAAPLKGLMRLCRAFSRAM